MPVKSSAVGTRFGERTIDITPRMMLAYAAAIGQTGAVTFDDADRDLFMAVPQFCVSLEWPTVSNGDVHALLGTTAQERLQTLHLGQDSLFHQPMVAGQRLRISGTVAGVRATRAGAVTVSKLETIDARTGDPVVTTWTTALMRGATVEGDDQSLDNGPDVPMGRADRPATVAIPVARELPHVYSECSGIWNPIHTERSVALSAGLPDIILHGTATWALAGREIIRHRAGGDPRRLRRLGGRFTGVVIPGGVITLEHGPAKDSGLCVRFRVLNDDGIAAVEDGVAELGEA